MGQPDSSYLEHTLESQFLLSKFVQNDLSRALIGTGAADAFNQSILSNECMHPSSKG